MARTTAATAAWRNSRSEPARSTRNWRGRAAPPPRSGHRALGDAHLLWQFWQKIHERFPPGHLEAMVRELTGHPSLPPHLDPEQIADLPDTPGVYLFYGERGGAADGASLPLYIGKSTRLRSRVLSHFAADYKSMFGELPSETLRNAVVRSD